MKYVSSRKYIRSGDLLAYSSGSWSSWSNIKVNLIRIFTRSTYSHVGIAWKAGGRIFILEATKPKIRIFPLSLTGNFYHISMGAKWSDKTEEYALSKIGTEYSEFTAVRAFFAPLEDGNIQQCAAYVREVLEKDGINLGEFSRPDMVVQAALNLGKKLTYIESDTNEI